MTMPSLDGYSLNEKMDKEFERIDEQIEVVKFRIDKEMEEIKERFVKLNEYINALKPISSLLCVKSMVSNPKDSRYVSYPPTLALPLYPPLSTKVG